MKDALATARYFELFPSDPEPLTLDYDFAIETDR